MPEVAALAGDDFALRTDELVVNLLRTKQAAPPGRRSRSPPEMHSVHQPRQPCGGAWIEPAELLDRTDKVRYAAKSGAKSRLPLGPGL